MSATSAHHPSVSSVASSPFVILRSTDFPLRAVFCRVPSATHRTLVHSVSRIMTCIDLYVHREPLSTEPIIFRSLCLSIRVFYLSVSCFHRHGSSIASLNAFHRCVIHTSLFWCSSLSSFRISTRWCASFIWCFIQVKSLSHHTSSFTVEYLHKLFAISCPAVILILASVHVNIQQLYDASLPWGPFVYWTHLYGAESFTWPPSSIKIFPLHHFLVEKVDSECSTCCSIPPTADVLASERQVRSE